MFPSKTDGIETPPVGRSVQFHKMEILKQSLSFYFSFLALYWETGQYPHI